MSEKNRELTPVKMVERLVSITQLINQLNQTQKGGHNNEVFFRQCEA